MNRFFDRFFMPILVGFLVTSSLCVMLDLLLADSKLSSGIVIDKLYEPRKESTYVDWRTDINGNLNPEIIHDVVSEKFIILLKSDQGIFSCEINPSIWTELNKGDKVCVNIKVGILGEYGKNIVGRAEQ